MTSSAWAKLGTYYRKTTQQIDNVGSCTYFQTGQSIMSVVAIYLLTYHLVKSITDFNFLTDHSTKLVVISHCLPFIQQFRFQLFIYELGLTRESLFEILARSETRFLDPKFSRDSRVKISSETRFS
jgi:hypothetical protein